MNVIDQFSLPAPVSARAKILSIPRYSVVVFFWILSLFFLSACSFSLADDITPPPGSQQIRQPNTESAPISGPLYPLVPPDPESGQPIYAEKCAPCHGEFGLGNGPQAAELPNPVTALGSLEVARRAVPASWYMQVTRGNLEKFMPPFASLTDRQRWDVVAYALTLSFPAGEIARGSELFQANCTVCHGETGLGDGPQAASLSVKPKDLTNQEFLASRSNTDLFTAITEGVSPEMHAFNDSLSEADRWALAAFLRNLTFASSQAAASATEPPETQAGASPSSVDQPVSPEGDPVAAQASAGKIFGTVTHASGGEIPDGLEVNLRGFDEMQLVYTQTTTLDPDGGFQFLNVDMPVGRAFMAVTEFEQAAYGSDLAIVEEATTELELPVIIYGTTTDMTVLRADRLHLFFEFVDAVTLRVIELYIVSNSSEKTFVPTEAGQPSVTFNLPEGYANLEFQDGVLGERYTLTPGGFGDTVSVRPGSGTYEALFAYTLPYDRKLELKLKASMPIDAVILLVPEGQIKIKSDQLQDGGVRDVEEVKYHAYSGSGLQAGDDLDMTITGKFSTGNPGLAESSNTNLIIGMSVFGLTLISSGVWLFMRNRRKDWDDDEDVYDSPEAHTAESAETSESLMDAIIALDDLYQAGKLAEDAYQQRRDELRSRLKELL